jgi:SAM-dependent methyltransferase
VSNVLFALDEPQYHTARFDHPCRFRGAALALSGEPIRTIRIQRGERVIAESPVNVPCPEFGFLPIANAATSRFEFMATLTDGAPYELWGDGTLLFEFDPAQARAPRLTALAAAVEALPVPDDDLLIATQGGANPKSYRDSIVSGFFTAETLLTRAGIQPENLRSVLDLGCGTGRLLIGWHLSDPTRRTVGLDINGELIGWNKTHLPKLAEWSQSTDEPPLAFEPESFDLMILTSVFTHLPLAWQRTWIREIERLLTPGGVALLTLNSTPYVKTILDPDGRALYESLGYAEGVGGTPGGNSYSTYHSPRFVAELVRPLVPLAAFPMGRPQTGAPSWFPMAAWQDIYVIQKQRA